MSTSIYFIRHTDVHNPDDVLYGRLPRFGLSDLGLSQAETTASVLAEMPVDIFYTSPQLRARQTTQILASAHPGVPVRMTHMLAEVRTGWQGRPHAELEEIDFNFYANPLHTADEDLDQLWARITRFVKLARRRHAGGAVAAVTHGDLCSLARAGFRGLPIEIASIRLPHPYPGKGSLTHLCFPDDLEATYPISVDYYDPNGDQPEWAAGWSHLPILTSADGEEG